MATLFKACSGFNILSNLLKPRVEVVTVSTRGRRQNPHPKKRYSPWLLQPYRIRANDGLTTENKEFVQDVIESKYGKPDPLSGAYSPLKIAPIEPITTEWTPLSRRTGLIARKIGIYPMWLKDGRKVLSTLLHVCDNHVIKYIPPEEWKPIMHPSRKRIPLQRKWACMLVGADGLDPQVFTKQYSGLFTDAGVMPKRLLARFTVSPDAALQPGTPLTAAHFRPGDIVDIRAKTMDRGFQGVMKRWGFKGMPDTHGVTKTHRRPGNIGSGGNKARVMPGTRMPGHMGNRYRIFRGIKILRINTKYNVIWVLGQAIPGETNSLLYMYDCVAPLKRPILKEKPPPFPTYIPKDDEPLPEEMFLDELHQFDAPSIKFKVEDKK